MLPSDGLRRLITQIESDVKSAFKANSSAVRAFEGYARVAAVLMCVVGALGALGWYSRAHLLPMIGGQEMRFMASLSFVIAGLGLLAHCLASTLSWLRGLSVLASLSVMVLGLDAVVAHGLSSGPWLSGWFDASLGEGRKPTMMAALAGVGFACLGGQGVLMALRRGIVLRELLALTVLAIAMASLASVAFTLAQHGDSLFDELPGLTGVMLLVGTLGWMSSSPTHGLTKIAVSATLGGLVARTLLLPALLLPAIYMFVFKTLEARYGVSVVVSSTLGALFTGGTVAALVWGMAMLLDRSERQKEASQSLRVDAETDPLTGLGNRRRFDQAMQSAMLDFHERGRPFVLLLVDIDYFKTYNDSYGHQAGDQALCAVANVLRETLRPQDWAIRYGGEEFALLISQVNLLQVSAIAERLLQTIRHWPFQHRQLTVSIGGAEVCSQDTVDILLGRADMALYQAKRRGRNRYESAACCAEQGGHPAQG